jgi:uncharacterized membrane protein YfcA
MTTDVLLALLLLVGVGAYVQTVTGFAMGLIIMGAATLFDLVPVPFSAVVVTMTSMFNILLALSREHHHIHWRSVVLASLGMAPALILGVLLLDYLSAESTRSLKLLLGLFILVGATLLVLKPHPRQALRVGWRDVLAGGLGGFFGGLFSTAGPPLVYHLYRQPFGIDVIRTTLLAIFGFTTLLRNGFVALSGDFSLAMLNTSLLAIPVVYLATLLGQRFPPPFAEQGMRRLAFALLALLGLLLLI